MLFAMKGGANMGDKEWEHGLRQIPIPEKESTLKHILPVMICLIAFTWLSFSFMYKWALAVGDTVKGSIQENSKPETDRTIKEYEREKFTRLKRNIGRRFITAIPDRPSEFYESPDHLERKVRLEGKERFQITEVVQNRLGTMYFYEVKFESGKKGYLSADGNNLEIRILEGRFISLSPKRTAKKVSPKTKSLHTVDMGSEAVEMVKNHLTGKDPITEERKTVEKRMADAKASSLPNLKWRYEAKEIGDYRYRVTQYVEGKPGSSTTRTWIVDLYRVKVTPENAAAKKLY